MFVYMSHTLGKLERLKSRKLIERLYLQGNSIKVFPLRMVYLSTEHGANFPTQAGFSVSKRKFKNAVDRNRLKRQLREAYRIHKPIVYDNTKVPHVYMISYIGNEKIKFEELSIKMEKLLLKFLEKINSTEHEK